MLGYPKENFSVLFTSRRQLLLNRESMIEVWDLLTGKLESAFIDDGAITSLKYLSKFNCLVCESKTGAVHLLELRQYVGMDGKTLEGQDLARQQPIPLLEEYKESVVVVTPTVEEIQTISVSLEKAPESVPDSVEIGQPVSVSPVAPLHRELAPTPRLLSLQGHTGLVGTVALTPDKRLVISASDDTLKVWEIESGDLLHSLEAWGVSSFSVTPDGRQVVYISNADAITFVNLESGQVVNSLQSYFGTRICSLEMTPDGTKLVLGLDNGHLTVRDVVSGRELHSLKGHLKAVRAIALTPNGEQVVSGSVDSTLKLWKLINDRPPNLRDWEPTPSPLLRSFDGHTGVVMSVAVTPDGQQVISGSWDKTIKVWDLASGSIIRSLEGHTEFVTSVVVTSDGKQVVSGSGDKTLRVWDMINGKSQTLFENDKVIWSLYLSHDSRWVICGDELGRVWVFAW
jgi:WD40 repeat protein